MSQNSDFSKLSWKNPVCEVFCSGGTFSKHVGVFINLPMEKDLLYLEVWHNYCHSLSLTRMYVHNLNLKELVFLNHHIHFYTENKIIL